MGYSANYGNVRIVEWNQIYRNRDLRYPEPGLITRATTPSFWRGFQMMLPVLTTLTGFDGKTGLRVHHATALRAGA